MDISAWQSQLRKGAAELVVLSLLAKAEQYGLQILEGANARGELVSEGALYPLLTRLEKEGKLVSRWATSDAPHPRKYYRLSNEGEALQNVMTEAWVEFRIAMTAAVEQA